MATVNTAWDHRGSNIFKTWVIMFFFSLFTVAVVYIIAQGFGYGSPRFAGEAGEVGGLGVVGFALIMAGVMNFVSYFWSDKIVLGVSGAKPIQKKDNPEIYRIVENLCIAAGLPLPKIYIIDDTATNAFATGRDPKHAAIAYTKGILQKLSKTELEGVTAHELSHVGNRDTLVMAVVSVLVGTIALLSDFFMRSMWYGSHGGDRDSKGNTMFMVIAIVAAILAPIVATLIQLAVSRRREFLADANGALLTRHPKGLADALKKIRDDKEPLVDSANKATAHMYIENPLRAFGGRLNSLFSTHPDINERIKKLEGM